MQLGVPAPDRADPTEPHRETADRLPFQVVVELAMKVLVQARTICALVRQRDRLFGAKSRNRLHRRGGASAAEEGAPLQIQPRTVENKTRDTAQPGAHPQTVKP
ncbi:Uncharacterised protein [Mycobacteroides abscessus subsp. abscessus]|nr:Uncharacterised protein [Mycobacteroides abscessus subsp. abscessus]